MRISDWSSDVCSSDLDERAGPSPGGWTAGLLFSVRQREWQRVRGCSLQSGPGGYPGNYRLGATPDHGRRSLQRTTGRPGGDLDPGGRSEEQTSELQSLMRISYAVLCLKKKTSKGITNNKQ